MPKPAARRCRNASAERSAVDAPLHAILDVDAAARRRLGAARPGRALLRRRRHGGAAPRQAPRLRPASRTLPTPLVALATALRRAGHRERPRRRRRAVAGAPACTSARTIWRRPTPGRSSAPTRSSAYSTHTRRSSRAALQRAGDLHRGRPGLRHRARRTPATTPVGLDLVRAARRLAPGGPDRGDRRHHARDGARGARRRRHRGGGDQRSARQRRSRRARTRAYLQTLARDRV